jgi:hypothetical protein
MFFLNLLKVSCYLLIKWSSFEFMPTIQSIVLWSTHHRWPVQRDIAIQIRTIVSRVIKVWTIIYHGICYLLKFHILFCGSETVACLSESCRQQNSVSQRLVISVLQKETKASKCRPLQSAKWNRKTALNLIRSCGFKNCKMIQRNTNDQLINLIRIIAWKCRWSSRFVLHSSLRSFEVKFLRRKT